MEIKIWWPLSFICSVLVTCILIVHSDLSLADLLLESGRYDEAIAKYRQVAETGPAKEEALGQLVRLYMLSGVPDSAIALYEKAAPDYLHDRRILEQIATIYSSREDKRATIATFERLVREHPEVVENRIKLAEAYAWNANWSKASTAYRALLEDDPDNTAIIRKQLYICLNVKQFDEAIRLLKQLREQEPEDRESRILLANLYIERGRKREAVAELEHLLEADPRNAGLRLKLADLYSWMERYRQGIEHYEYLLARDPGNQAYFDRLMSLTQNREPQRAIGYFAARLSKHPNDIPLRERFVESLDYLGYTDTAVDHLKKLNRLQPQEPKHRMRLAELYISTRQPSLATQTFENMLRDGFFEADAISELTKAYHLHKEYGKLKEMYTVMARKGALNESQLSDYISVLVAGSDYKDAAKQYASMVEIRPGNLGYRQALAELYRLQGQEGLALQVIRKGLVKAEASDEQFLTYAAQFLAKAGRLDESSLCYEKLIAGRSSNVDEYQILLLDQYAKSGQAEKALELNRVLASAYPDRLDLRFSLASIHWVQSEFQEMHDIIAEITPARYQTRHLDRQIAAFYFERKFFQRAIVHLQEQLRTSPQDSLSLRMIGLALAWNNQPKKSIEYIRDYHELVPNDYYTHYQLGALLLGQGNQGEARREFRRASQLIDLRASDKESRIVRAKILAHTDPDRFVREFDALLADYPADLLLRTDYAASLIERQHYAEAQNVLGPVLARDPIQVEALRLTANSHFQQRKYFEAAQILRQLSRLNPRDTGLRLDLADVELSRGDWYGSMEILEDILKESADNLPAQQRLAYLRRTHPQGFAAEYQDDNQSNSVVRRVVDLSMSKAYASWLQLKAYFKKDTYVAGERVQIETLGAEFASSVDRGLETTASGHARWTGDNWYLSGKTRLQWNLSPGNSLATNVELNRLWNDPFSATLFGGSLNHFSYDLNLVPSERTFLWNRISHEQHSIRGGGRFGAAYRTFLQAGYRWLNQPQLTTYYQLYHLKYRYARDENRRILSIPAHETIHSVGLGLSQQLNSRIFYELGGSLGFNKDLQTFQYNNSVELEYMIRNYLRVRTAFNYGSQDRLSGTEASRSMRFGLWYHY